MADGTDIILAPRPFARADEVALRQVPAGLTVSGMLALMETQGHLDPACRSLVRVTAGDQVLPPHLWPIARPKAGVVLYVDVVPGKSNPLRTLLQLAVVALATYVGFVIGGWQGALAAAAITIGGNFLINAIAPIPQPHQAEQKARLARYSLNGASNAARPHEPIPIVLGRRRIYPPRAANWYTTTVANVVYLRLLFQPSVGWLEREDVRLGETLLSSYEGVTIRWNTKPSDALSLSMFAATPSEEQVGPILAKQTTGWITRAAPIACDHLSVDVAVLNGLFNTHEKKGDIINRSVSFEVRYGPRGGDPDSATPFPFGSSGVVTWTRADVDSYREEFAWDVTRAEYDIHLRRTSADNTDARAQDEVSWVCIRAFRDEAPIRDLTDVPWIELELQATDQLNGVPDNFNFVATSMVPQAQAGGPGALIATRNPADLFLALLSAPFSDIDLDADERDYAAIATWRALCVTEGWKCDLVEDGEASVGELLVRAAACGRARPTLDFGAVTVVIDWEKPLVRTMFTPRNVRGFRGEVAYPEEVHGLRVRFQNEEKRYEDDTITVFAPGYTEETATRYDSLEIRDKSDPDEVEWEAARVVGERIARPERFTFEQDVEYLVVREGDRAYLQHHVALIAQVAGRVMELVMGPGGPIGLRLDEAVLMELGVDYDVRWRSATPDAVTGQAPFVTGLQNKPGERHVVFFATPGALPAVLPAVGDLISVGEHALEVLDVIVDSIRPKAGLMAEISCIPYAPELMAVGETPITSYRTGASVPPMLPGAYMPPRDIIRLGALNNTAIQIARSGWTFAHQAFSDGFLTPAEKRELIGQMDAMIAARTTLRVAADALGLFTGQAVRDAYEAGFTAWSVYIAANLTAPYDFFDLDGETAVGAPEDFMDILSALATGEMNLRTAIASGLKGAVDAVALASGDGVLSQGEKPTVVPVITALVNGRAALRSVATDLGLTIYTSTERDAYETAATTLDAHLATLTAPVAWNTYTGDTTIASPSVFRAVYLAALETEKNLVAAINQKAKDRLGVWATYTAKTPSGVLQNLDTSGNLTIWTALPGVNDALGNGVSFDNFPLTSDDTNIYVAAVTVTGIGYSRLLPSATLSGLTAGTSYAVVFQWVGNYWAAVDPGAIDDFVSSADKWLFVGIMQTSSSGLYDFDVPYLEDGYLGGVGTFNGIYAP